MKKEEKTMVRDAIWHLNGFIEYFKNQPMLTPDEEVMYESAKDFVLKANRKLKKVI
jgi:hypothetical protein